MMPLEEPRRTIKPYFTQVPGMKVRRNSEDPPPQPSLAKALWRLPSVTVVLAFSTQPKQKADSSLCIRAQPLCTALSEADLTRAKLNSMLFGSYWSFTCGGLLPSWCGSEDKPRRPRYEVRPTVRTPGGRFWGGTLYHLPPRPRRSCLAPPGTPGRAGVDGQPLVPGARRGPDVAGASRSARGRPGRWAPSPRSCWTRTAAPYSCSRNRRHVRG